MYILRMMFLLVVYNIVTGEDSRGQANMQEEYILLRLGKNARPHVNMDKKDIPSFMKELHSLVHEGQGHTDGCIFSNEFRGNVVTAIKGNVKLTESAPHLELYFNLPEPPKQEIPQVFAHATIRIDVQHYSDFHLVSTTPKKTTLLTPVCNSKTCEFDITNHSKITDTNTLLFQVLSKDKVSFRYGYSFYLVITSIDRQHCGPWQHHPDGSMPHRSRRSIGSVVADRGRLEYPSICHVRPMRVDFKLLGWHEWVIAPSRYYANQCQGECPYPLNEYLNGTNHAVLQTLMHSMDEDRAPETCCIPTTMAPISLLFLDGKDSVTLRKYDDMVVTSCGCR